MFVELHNNVVAVKSFQGPRRQSNMLSKRIVKYTLTKTLFLLPIFQLVLLLLCVYPGTSLRLPRWCSNRCLTDADCEDPEFSVCLPRKWCSWWFCWNTCQPAPDGPCFPDPCLNGGTCVSEDARYKCDCPPTYAGRNCEIEVPPHPCDSNPCVNGMCNILGPSDFDCTCTDGWEGPLCDTGFLCGDLENTCVPFSVICNGSQECSNGFDESQCCGDSNIDFQCGPPTYCIPSSAACDENDDCIGTDIDETFFCNRCTVTPDPGE